MSHWTFGNSGNQLIYTYTHTHTHKSGVYKCKNTNSFKMSHWTFENSALAACERGAIEIVKKFIEEGWDVNHFYEQGYPSGLAAACGGNQFQMVKFLIENGAKTRIDQGKIMSELSYACEGGGIEIIEYILDHGGVIDSVLHRTAVNFPPLHIVVKTLNCEKTELLLKRGANPNSEDLHGDRILHNTIYGGVYESQEMFDLLLKYGADVNMRSGIAGHTPLHEATTAPINLKAVRMLISAGADLSPQNKMGMTCLENACFYRSLSTVKYLVGVGALKSQSKYRSILSCVATIGIDYGVSTGTVRRSLNQSIPCSAMKLALYLISKGEYETNTPPFVHMVHKARKYALLADSVHTTDTVRFIHGFNQ